MRGVSLLGQWVREGAPILNMKNYASSGCINAERIGPCSGASSSCSGVDSAKADALVAQVLNGKICAQSSTSPKESEASKVCKIQAAKKPTSRKRQLNFYADPEVRQAVRRLAFERDCTMSDILNEAVRAYALAESE